MKTRRLIALALSLVMLFSLLPASAFAEEFEAEEFCPEEVFVLEAEPEPEAPAAEEPEPEPELPEEPAVLWCEVTFDLCGHGEPMEPVFVPCGSALEKPEDPRAEGFDYWLEILDDGLLTREQVNYYFGISPEFQGITASFGLS